MGAFMTTIICSLRVRWTRDPSRFAKSQVAVDLAIVTSLVCFSGGYGSVFGVFHALVVFDGAAFLGRSGVTFSCGLAALGYALVFSGERSAFFP